MQNSVDAALLGGAVIRAGDLVIDGSLKGLRLGTTWQYRIRRPELAARG